MRFSAADDPRNPAAASQHEVRANQRELGLRNGLLGVGEQGFQPPDGSREPLRWQRPSLYDGQEEVRSGKRHNAAARANQCRKSC